MASGSGKAKASTWVTAMGAGTVEALKDQHGGPCRWSHAFRCVQPRAGSAAAGNGACGRTKQAAVPTIAGGAAAARRKAKQEEEEEELRTVMYLSNWGPNN